MEQYQTLIGVVIEKIDQTYKELKFNFNGLEGVLNKHTEEEIANTPELLTITMLRDMYNGLIQEVEKHLPGVKD
jgi:hypothetical protein